MWVGSERTPAVFGNVHATFASPWDSTSSSSGATQEIEERLMIMTGGAARPVGVAVRQRGLLTARKERLGLFKRSLTRMPGGRNMTPSRRPASVVEISTRAGAAVERK